MASYYLVRSHQMTIAMMAPSLDPMLTRRWPWTSRCWLTGTLLVAAVVGALQDHGSYTTRIEFNVGDSWQHLAEALLETTDDVSEASNEVSLRRLMEGNDFAVFNNLLANTKVALPDFEVSQRVVFNTFRLWINELRCQDIYVDDIRLTWNLQSEQRGVMSIFVTGLEVNCFGHYNYDWGFVDGNGDVRAYTQDNSVSTRIAFNSTNFTTAPPDAAVMETCDAQLDVWDLKFDGRIVANVLNAAEPLVRERIEKELEGVLCNEMSSLAADFLTGLMDKVETELKNYTAALDPNLANALFPESMLVVPPDVTLVNYSDIGNSLGSWVTDAFGELDQLFGESTFDENMNKTDLGVNVILRDELLDADRALTINVTDLPFDGFDGVLFQSHDILTETTITLTQVRIYGIDTFTRFEPLVDIGSYTLQNELSWDYIDVELAVTVEIRPSTKEDAILIDPDPNKRVVEQVLIDFGLDDLDVFVSVLMALDRNKLGALQLGSLLQSKNILSCFLSTVYDMEIAGLNVSVASIRDPVLSGFLSPGIDHIVSKIVQAAFAMYEPSFLTAMPGIFQKQVRKIVQSKFLDEGPFSPNESQCPGVAVTARSAAPFIDFRDLFLKPTESKKLGGSGEEPYGDVGYLAYDIIQNRFIKPESNGTLPLNELLIAPFTEGQSGTSGMLHFPKTLIAFVETDIDFGDFMDRFEISLADLRVSNLDTFADPINLLSPTRQANVVDNTISAGLDSSRRLNTSVALHIGIDSPIVPLRLNDTMDISFSVDAIELAADILARMSTDGVLTFPVKSLLNPDCWLATLADGSDSLEEASRFALEAFQVALSSFRLEARCTSCSSKGTAYLSDIMATMESSGAMDLLAPKFATLLQSVVQSDALQQYANQAIADAALFCPTEPSYDANAVRSKASLGLPALPTESIDTLMYAASLVGQIAFVVAIENHRAYTPEASDTLSAQNALSAENNTRLMDWTNLGVSLGIGPIADRGLAEIRAFLATSDGDGGPQINTLIGNLADKDGVLKLKFDDLDEVVGDFYVAFQEVRLKGLDSFEQIDILKPVAPQTVKNMFTISNVSLEFDLAFDFLSTSDPPLVLTFGFDIYDINANASLFVALDLDKAGSIPLGSLLNTSNILPCFLSAMHGIEITQLDISFGSFAYPRILGLMPDTHAALATSIEAMTDRFREHIVEAVPKIFATTVKAAINEVLFAYVRDPQCAFEVTSLRRNLEAAKHAFVDFRNLLLPREDALSLGASGGSPYGDLVRVLVKVVKENLLIVNNETNSLEINSAVIAKVTELQSNTTGRLTFPGELVSGGADVDVGGLRANVELRVSDAFISNLDTFGKPLSVFDPVNNEAHELQNIATVGVDRAVRAGTRLFIGITGDDTVVSNELNISLSLSTLSLVVTALLRIAESAFFEFPLRDVNKASCWLSLMPAPGLDAKGVRMAAEESSLTLTDLMASVADVSLNVSCLECSSPRMYELATLLQTPNAKSAATAVANDIFDYAASLLGGQFLQVRFDRLLNDAVRRCPHSPEFVDRNASAVEYEAFEFEEPEDSMHFFIVLAIIVALLILVVSSIVVAVKVIVRRRNKKWLRTLRADQVLVLHSRQQKDRDFEEGINEASTSLFKSSDIAQWIRIVIPIVVVGNVGLFMAGHLTLGGSVNIEAVLAGQSFRVENFFSFSIAQSTVDIWNAGGKELAIMIFIFSVLWPYTKQVITLFLWFAPPSRVSVAKRFTVLLWLDVLSKWSIIDVFTLILTLAAFNIEIQSPDVAFLPDGFYSVHLLVVPKLGLYLNMTAQLVTQLNSHLIIHYHRRVRQNAEAALRATQPPTAATVDAEDTVVGSDTCDEKTSRLCDHAFARPHRAETEKVVVRSGTNAGVVVIAAIMSIFVILGCSLPSFSLETLGIIGVVVESGQQFEQAETYHSVFTIIGMMFQQAAFTGGAGDFIGLGVLSILLVLTVLIVPIVQAGVLAYMWLRAVDQRRRYRTAVAIEILQAWQYTEVYLIAVLVTSWQLGPVSDFMINSYCRSLDEFFAELVFYGVLSERDAQCFRVNPHVESASYILAAAAVLLAVLNSFVMKAVSQYFRDTNHAERVPPSDHCFDTDKNVDALRDAITPAPVLFSDTFRWFLVRNKGGGGSSTDDIAALSTGSWSGGEGDEVPLHASTPATTRESPQSALADKVVPTPSSSHIGQPVLETRSSNDSLAHGSFDEADCGSDDMSTPSEVLQMR